MFVIIIITLTIYIYIYIYKYIYLYTYIYTYFSFNKNNLKNPFIHTTVERPIYLTLALHPIKFLYAQCVCATQKSQQHQRTLIKKIN